MVEKMFTVTNRAGIHMRPGAVIVQAIKDYKSNIFFERGSERINAKSIMGILTLVPAYGAQINVIAEGEDEEKAMATIERLFETKFEEE